MAIITIPKKNIRGFGILEVKGEKFVILKKAQLDELALLMKSVFDGETLLKERKTRSFNEFVKSLPKRKK